MILVTGVSGFIGKHLIETLCERFNKDEILALTSKPITNCLYVLHNNYSFENDFLKNSYPSIETIVHVGSFIPKDWSKANDWIECNSNITNTAKLLEVQIPKLKRFIYISTVDVYNSDSIIMESTAVNPISLYAHSKLYCEIMLQSWAKKNQIDLSILRIGHVYGPGEELYSKVIPATMRKLLKNEPLTISGSGNEVRSFIFVKDVVDVIINSITSKALDDIVNVAGSHPVTINELFKKLILISDQQTIIENSQSSIKARSLIFDTGRMKKILGREETNLDEGLRIEWEYMKSILS